MKVQDLSLYRFPKNFRGRNVFVVQTWWFVQAVFFNLSPQFMYGWRRFLLRLFGARIGTGVILRPSVKVTYPWKVRIGDRSWLGDDVVLYSLGEIEIGADTVISQKCYLSAGSHKYNKTAFPIYSEKISIEDECWLATDVFVACGITVGKGTVVGARSSIFNNLPAGKVCYGSPAKVIRDRSNDEL